VAQEVGAAKIADFAQVVGVVAGLVQFEVFPRGGAEVGTQMAGKLGTSLTKFTMKYWNKTTRLW
jgi:hypothetical protein